MYIKLLCVAVYIYTVLYIINADTKWYSSGIVLSIH